MSLEDELRAATGGGFMENRPPVSADPDLIVGILSDDKLVKVLPDVSNRYGSFSEDFPADETDVEILEVFTERLSTEAVPISQAHSMETISTLGKPSSLKKTSSHSTPSKTPKQQPKLYSNPADHSKVEARKAEKQQTSSLAKNKKEKRDDAQPIRDLSKYATRKTRYY